jgi:hypothetical protein
MGFRYGNFFIPWVEKTLKLARGKEKLTSRGLIFGGFFNPWDEEISIPETQTHSEILY